MQQTQWRDWHTKNLLKTAKLIHVYSQDENDVYQAKTTTTTTNNERAIYKHAKPSGTPSTYSVPLAGSVSSSCSKAVPPRAGRVRSGRGDKASAGDPIFQLAGTQIPPLFLIHSSTFATRVKRKLTSLNTPATLKLQTLK